MTVKDILIDELKRLNRINEIYEKEIIKGTLDNEPEQNIVNNVKAMCEIASNIINNF